MTFSVFHLHYIKEKIESQHSPVISRHNILSSFTKKADSSWFYTNFSQTNSKEGTL